MVLLRLPCNTPYKNPSESTRGGDFCCRSHLEHHTWWKKSAGAAVGLQWGRGSALGFTSSIPAAGLAPAFWQEDFWDSSPAPQVSSPSPSSWPMGLQTSREKPGQLTILPRGRGCCWSPRCLLRSSPEELGFHLGRRKKNNKKYKKIN